MYLRVIKEDSLADALVKEGRYYHTEFLQYTTHDRIDSVYSLATLESKLLAYVNNPEAQTEAFDIQAIPKVSREQARQEAARVSF